jgi:flagellar basal-body rod modification protein FlgD
MSVNALQSSSLGSVTNNAIKSSSPSQMKDEFLQLLVAQIKNQDPLNPMDGTEYVAQLAQLSTVEGIENMSQLQNQNNILMDTLQVLQSTQLVGKDVSVSTDQISLKENDTVKGSFSMPGSAEEVQVIARDPSGKIVEAVNLGTLIGGQHNFTLPELKKGDYILEVVALNGETTKNFQPSVTRTVEKIIVPSDGGSDIRLNVDGIGLVSLFSINEFLGEKS